MVPPHLAERVGEGRRVAGLRDFISGDEATKERGADQSMTAAVVFACRIVDVFREYEFEMPEGMRCEMQEAVDWFMGAVSEFVDVGALMRSFGEATDATS